MAMMLEIALLSAAAANAAPAAALTGIWGDLYGLVGDDPVLAAAILLFLSLVLAASLLWLRHSRSEARKLEAFLNPLSAFE